MPRSQRNIKGRKLTQRSARMAAIQRMTVTGQLGSRKQRMMQHLGIQEREEAISQYENGLKPIERKLKRLSNRHSSEASTHEETTLWEDIVEVISEEKMNAAFSLIPMVGVLVLIVSRAI